MVDLRSNFIQLFDLLLFIVRKLLLDWREFVILAAGANARGATSQIFLDLADLDWSSLLGELHNKRASWTIITDFNYV